MLFGGLWRLHEAGAGFAAQRRGRAMMPALTGGGALGLAQSRHDGSLESDADPENGLRRARDADGAPRRAASGMPLPVRAWTIVLAAAAIWVAIALAVLLVF